MAIPRNSKQQVLDVFNSIEPRLQFTMEIEEDRKLAFLDMTVIRNPDQTLITEWYAKPIASGRMLNYKSFHQVKHKINVANNFIHRVLTLTHNKSVAETTKTIHQHLQGNNYPKQLINRLLNLYKPKRQDHQSLQSIDTSNRTSVQQSSMPPTAHPAAASPVDQFRPPPTQPATAQSATAQSATTQFATAQSATTSTATVQLTSQQSTFHHPEQTPASQQTSETSSHTNGLNSIQLSPQQPTTQNTKLFRSIPHIPALSHRISKLLSTDYPNISIATRQIHTVQDLHTKIKQPVSKEEINNVIYKIPCKDCDSCYIGMTRNNLRRRLAGHKSNVNKLEKMFNNDHTITETEKATLIETTTALVQHCVETNHRFDLHLTQIIDHSYKSSSLPILEMCHITNTNHTVNKRTDIDKLNTTYAAILHSIKNINEHNRTRREESNRDRAIVLPTANEAQQ